MEGDIHSAHPASGISWRQPQHEEGRWQRRGGAPQQQPPASEQPGHWRQHRQQQQQQQQSHAPQWQHNAAPHYHPQQQQQQQQQQYQQQQWSGGTWQQQQQQQQQWGAPAPVWWPPHAYPATAAGHYLGQQPATWGAGPHTAMPGRRTVRVAALPDAAAASAAAGEAPQGPDQQQPQRPVRRPRAKKSEASAEQQQQPQAAEPPAAGTDGERKPRRAPRSPRSDAGRPRGATAKGAGTPPPNWESIYSAAGVIFYDVVGSDDSDPPPADFTAPMPPLPAALRSHRASPGDGDATATTPPAEESPSDAAPAAAAAAAAPHTAAEVNGAQRAAPTSAGKGVRVLLVNQGGSGTAGKFGWSWMAGKRVKDECPRTTAAREVEEESHGLLPASLVAPVLKDAPIVWWEGGKMVTFLVALRGADELPHAFEEAVAAGRINPEAESVNAAAWVSLWRVKSSSLELMKRGVSRFSSKFSPEMVDKVQADGHIFLRRFVPNILKQTGVIRRLSAINFGEQCSAGAAAAGAPGQLRVRLTTAAESGLPVFELAASSNRSSGSSSSGSSGGSGKSGGAARGAEGGGSAMDSIVAANLPSAERSAAVAADLAAGVAAAAAAVELGDANDSGGGVADEVGQQQQQQQESIVEAGSGINGEAPSLERWGEVEAALRQLSSAGNEA